MGWLQTTAVSVTVMGGIIGLALMAETFRSAPWPGPDTDRPVSSPRQRRILGAGLVLVSAGQLISQQLEGDTPLWAVSFVLSISGSVCLIAALFRRGSDANPQGGDAR